MRVYICIRYINSNTCPGASIVYPIPQQQQWGDIQEVRPDYEGVGPGNPQPPFPPEPSYESSPEP